MTDRGWKADEHQLNCLRSLANHVVYGVGLYLAALARAHVRASWA